MNFLQISKRQIDKGILLHSRNSNGLTDVSDWLIAFLLMHFTVKGDCEELEDKFIELENVVKFDVDEKRREKRKVKKFRLCKNVLGEGGMSLVSVMSATLQQTKLSIFLYKEILVKESRLFPWNMSFRLHDHPVPLFWVIIWKLLLRVSNLSRSKT